MRRSLGRTATILAIGATTTVAVVAGALFAVVCGPMVTQPETHAAEDASFGLIVFMPLWIAGATGAALAIGLWRGWAGRRAGLAWAAWTALAGLLVGAITGLTGIIGAALSGQAGGYDLARPDLYISVVLWVAAVVVVVAVLLPGRAHTAPGWR